MGKNGVIYVISIKTVLTRVDGSSLKIAPALFAPPRNETPWYPPLPLGRGGYQSPLNQAGSLC